jgi:hypothetical protein
MHQSRASSCITRRMFWSSEVAGCALKPQAAAARSTTYFPDGSARISLSSLRGGCGVQDVGVRSCIGPCEFRAAPVAIAMRCTACTTVNYACTGPQACARVLSSLERVHEASLLAFSTCSYWPAGHRQKQTCLLLQHTTHTPQPHSTLHTGWPCREFLPNRGKSKSQVRCVLETTHVRRHCSGSKEKKTTSHAPLVQSSNEDDALHPASLTQRAAHSSAGTHSHRPQHLKFPIAPLRLTDHESAKRGNF